MLLYRCFKLNEKGEKVYINQKWYHAKNHAKCAVTCKEHWGNSAERERWYLEEYEPTIVGIVEEFDRKTGWRR